MTLPAKLTVRELQTSDIPRIANYWLTADADFLHGMGADPAKLPDAAQWQQMLEAQLTADYPDKRSYGIILEVDGRPIGHSNVNPVTFGEEGYLHLHIWQAADRGLGHGTELVRLALPFFFKNMQIKRLYCQPYAHNPAPNRTLPKLGFSFVKNFVTTPGSINFEQEVNLWVLEGQVKP
jgi:RimJ/RimL family protein N-acetyltransferase